MKPKRATSSGEPSPIRPMLAKEAEAVSDVIVAAVRADLPASYSPAVIEGLVKGNDPAAVRKHAPKQTDYVWLTGRRIVAMLGVKRNEIGHLFVHPDFAGRGIGRKLVEFAAGLFRQAGHQDMIVLSSLNAEGFYQRCGFVAEGGGSFPVGDNLPLEYVKMRARL